MNSTLTTAIADSITYDCIACVDVDGDLYEALGVIASRAYDYDHTLDSDGNLDVWGKDDDGFTFRVRLCAA